MCDDVTMMYPLYYFFCAFILVLMVGVRMDVDSEFLLSGSGQTVDFESK